MKTLYKNATIISMDENNSSYSFMGVEDKKIIFLSNNRPSEIYDKEIDLSGKFIYPILTDSHMHLLHSIVLSSSSFNICNVIDDKISPDCLEKVEASIKNYISQNQKLKFIMVNQYIPSAIKEKRLPNRFELDLWANNKEIVIFNIDGHSCSMSSSLLDKLHITSKTGIVTGKDYDMNSSIITNYLISKVSFSSIIKGVANFSNECAKYGIGKVCSLDGEDNGKYDIFLRLLVFIARRMDIHVRLYPQYINYKIINKYKKAMKNRRIGGCSKWELDGSVGSRSASFAHPFIDTNTTSQTYYQNEFISKKVKEALENKIQLTAHAIGTLAIDQIVNAYKENQSLIPVSGPLVRIDHFEFPSNEAIDFVCKNKIAITIQPGYSYFDKRYILSYTDALDKEDLSLICPLKTMVNNKAVLLGSSDCPVQSINPYMQMLGMIDYYDEKESISAYEAFKTYTYNPSIALDEKEGVISINGPASFFISNSDIIHSTKDNITNVEVIKMFIDGKEYINKTGSFKEVVKFIFKKQKSI